MQQARSKLLPVLVAGMLAVPVVLSQVAIAQNKSEAKPEAKTAAKAPAGGDTLATVNGVKIPKSRMDVLLKQAMSRGQPDSPEVRNAIKENLITGEVLVQEAKKRKLDQNAETAVALELARQGVLVQAYIQDYMKTAQPTDAQVSEEYEKLKKQMGEKEYKARHILVKTEDEAKDILAKLKKGEKFEKLAEEKSVDEGSKKSGGELGWNAPAAFVKPFSDAMVKLKKGETSTEPVKTDFGFHVIRLDEERAMQPPKLEEVKQNLVGRLQQQNLDKFIKELRAKAKVE